MSTHEHRTADVSQQEPDYFIYFSVFMLAFWPVTLVFGIASYCFTSYDLRLFDLLLGVLAGWIALTIYRKNEQKLAS